MLIQLELLGGCDPVNFSSYRRGTEYDALKQRRPANTKIDPAQVVPLDAAGNSIIGLHPMLGTPLQNAGSS